MQKFTVDTVTPGTKDTSPVVIVATDGTKMSGFDKKLADLLPGAVIEVELKVKGKFNNIEDWKAVSPLPGGRRVRTVDGGTAFLTNEQVAVVSSVYLLAAGIVDKESPLGKKVANWLLANIPADQFDAAGVKAISKPVHVPHTKEHKAPVNPDSFQNVGQFLTWAWETYKLPGSKVITI